MNWSNGVDRSDGVNWSNGVDRSDGVNWSNGVNGSYGVSNSFGVDNAIFLANKERTYSIFGKEVDKTRYNQVWEELHLKLDDWCPKFTNAFELYLKNGSDWKKVNASEIVSTLDGHTEPYQAWKDMPQKAIEYVKSLPEFDAEMFKEITGIEVESKETIEIGGIKYDKAEVEERLKDIKPVK